MAIQKVIAADVDVYVGLSSAELDGFIEVWRHDELGFIGGRKDDGSIVGPDGLPVGTTDLSEINTAVGDLSQDVSNQFVALGRRVVNYGGSPLKIVPLGTTGGTIDLNGDMTDSNNGGSVVTATLNANSTIKLPNDLLAGASRMVLWLVQSGAGHTLAIQAQAGGTLTWLGEPTPNFPNADGAFVLVEAMTVDGGVNWIAVHGTGSAGVPLTLADAAGDLLVASAADAWARLAKGANGTVLGVSSGNVGWVVPAGTVLATTYYNPGSIDAKTVTSTSASMVDLDATNLQITFTAPASGAVEVFMTAPRTFMSTGSNSGYWGLRESTNFLTGSETEMTRSSQNMHSAGYYMKITGLTPGNSYTYKWAAKVSADTLNVSAGGGLGPAVMRVTAA